MSGATIRHALQEFERIISGYHPTARLQAPHEMSTWLPQTGLDELDALLAENERLREALRDIASDGCADFVRGTCRSANPKSPSGWCGPCKAGAALAAVPEEDE